MGRPEVATVEAALDTQTGASFTLHGAGVSGGIAIGHAHLISHAQLEVAHYEIAAATRSTPEIARFDAAIEQVRGELRRCTPPCPPTRRPRSARSSTCT